MKILTLIKRIYFYSVLYFLSSCQSKQLLKTTDSYQSLTGNYTYEIWGNKNLDVAIFLNGDTIPEAKSNIDWKLAGQNGKPAWCYYENNPENGKIYGKLYNWYAINDSRGLVPPNWNICDKDDFSHLKILVQTSEKNNGGKKLKSKTGWKTKKIFNVNVSGFTALPGGVRDSDGVFYDIGAGGYFWSSSSEKSYEKAWHMKLYDNFNYVDLGLENKSLGMSVRCSVGSMLEGPLEEPSIPTKK